MIAALTTHNLLEPIPEADDARTERAGSEKRAIARDVLRDMDPDSPLLKISEQAMADDVFAPELDYMELENVYFDLWERTEVLDRRTRSAVTLGMTMGLANHNALHEHVPVALRNGVTVLELEELVYQAATYLGYASGKSIRATVAGALAKS